MQKIFKNKNFKLNSAKKLYISLKKSNQIIKQKIYTDASAWTNKKFLLTLNNKPAKHRLI